MEAPPLSATPIPAVAPPPQPPQTASHISYPDSVDSSPRSRNTDSWDEPPYGPTFTPNTTSPAAKLRLMCSYGGHIFPRPNDKSLCYVGGDTRIVVVDRHSSLSDLHNRLSKTLLNGKSFTLKYQLPNEDLDSLISVTTDEDVENMVDEYDRLHHSSGSSNSTTKNSRLRLFLFPTSVDSETSSSIESLMENSSKSHDWFVNALNWNSSACKVRAFSDTSSVNCLLGLDDSIENPAVKDETQLEASLSMKSAGGGGSGKPNNNINSNVVQDVHSVPDSPMLETSSSFGSTSSSPSMANLPPIKMHVEEGNNQKGLVGLGIEESFQQMSIVGAGGGPSNVLKQEDGGFVVAAPAAVAAGTMVAGLPMVVGGEFQNRVFSDDERSELGVPVGFRKQLQVQPQQQQQQQLQQQQQQLSQLQQQQASQLQQQQQQASQLQQSKQAGSFDLPSPDSVSSESSVTNPLSRQKPPMMYQEPLVQIQSGNSRALANQMDQKASDSNSRMQMQQQVQESGYVLPSQFDQYQQLHQPQQFVPAGAQYIHHHTPGAVPFYYPIYPSQQLSHPPALEHQYPVYYVPARQTQAYNMPVQQPGFNDSSPTGHTTRSQTPPSAAYNPATSATAAKPEMSTGAYRTSAAAPPQLVQVSSSQSSPQYAGFSQIHHPSQSIAPSAATANYAYEFNDPAHAQIYYTQPLTPQLAAQYQTMTSSPAVMLPEASSQLPTENIKQVRTPQQ